MPPERVISRLLLVEDDPSLGSALRRALEAAGHAVDWATRGEDGIALIEAEAYGVVLLDLGLPDVDGLEVIRAIRSLRHTARIIIITAQDRTSQRIRGLDAGADDYLVKPVDVDELAARVRAQLRRADRRATDLLTVRDIAIDLAGQTVALNGEPVAITAKEYKVLALLMRRAGQFITKSQIEAALYDNERLIESNTVEVAVSSLRRKLGREAIVTARGLGYMVAR
ncbi:response regulator transcription factor [Sphingomonas sp. AP4-R1]|uniref:response regulator transcription factor n=1 Tax=Sphingomonas sp. AP4-R1 TaxID=2735134 RepID=UPI001C0FD1B5|nr:response regulator transcription factor [Sphingomonas sp. AP4-R1]